MSCFVGKSELGNTVWNCFTKVNDCDNASVQTFFFAASKCAVATTYTTLYTYDQKQKNELEM